MTQKKNIDVGYFIIKKTFKQEVLTVKYQFRFLSLSFQQNKHESKFNYSPHKAYLAVSKILMLSFIDQKYRKK